MPDTIKPEGIRRIEAKPGDRFVIFVNGVISAEQRNRIGITWRNWFGPDPAPPLLVLDAGASLNVFNGSALVGEGQGEGRA